MRYKDGIHILVLRFISLFFIYLVIDFYKYIQFLVIEALPTTTCVNSSLYGEWCSWRVPYKEVIAINIWSGLTSQEIVLPIFLILFKGLVLLCFIFKFLLALTTSVNSKLMDI